MLKNLSTTYDCKSGGTPGGLRDILNEAYCMV